MENSRLLKDDIDLCEDEKCVHQPENYLHYGHIHDTHDECGHAHGTNDECGCGHTHDSHDECGCGHTHDSHTHDGQENGRHQPSSSVPKLGMLKKTFFLEHLGCANCAAKMESKIAALEGISSADITFATRQLRITAKNPESYLPQIQKICASIEDGVTVSLNPPGKTNTAAPKEAKHKELLFLLVGAALFLLGEILGRINFISSLAPDLLYVAAYLVLGGRIVITAAKNIVKGQIFDENFLMSIATLGAFCIGQFEEAVGVMLFFRVGEYFEQVAVRKSRSQIMDAVDLRPEVVSLVIGNGVKIIGAAEALPGDVLLVRPGDRIPLDATVIEGESFIDTSPITGEPVPVKAVPSDTVISGCVNTSAQLKIRVEKPLTESMVTRILDSVENAAASKPIIDRFITRFARIYTPIVVLLALGTAVVPSLFDGNWNYWVYTALTFLVMSCPCALVLSVPLAFFSGIGAGSKKGILFKGGTAIEAMGQIKVAVMDKTGTITQGNFVLQKTVPVGDLTEGELLHICASSEQNSTHPIAASIVAAAKASGLKLETPTALTEYLGQGIQADLSRGQVLCGSKKLMNRFDIPLGKQEDIKAGTEVFVAVNGTLAGHLIISDTLKPDAKTAIARLHQLHISTAMLTGDAEDSAQSVASETGIDEVHARLLPEDKLNRLMDIRKRKGAVMFVGDGINDAPVLAGADVGAAMGSGADAAIEAADVVFMTSAMEAIPQSLSIARMTGKIAIQNVVFALAVKIIVMALGLVGFSSMWMAVFADTGVAMLCILNSIRILYQK